MSAWPEAVYIINKIEDTLLEIQSFDEQIEEIRGANDRIVKLETQAEGYNSTLDEYAQQINDLDRQCVEIDRFINNEYDGSVVQGLGNRIEAIETSLSAKEELIAFKDTKEGTKHTKITSTGCIWFIEE